MRAPATGFSGELWDAVDDDWLQSPTVTSDDDDDVNMRWSWFQSYCEEQQLQLTPPVDTGSSHSGDSTVCHHQLF